MAILHSLLPLGHSVQASSSHKKTSHVELGHHLMTLVTSGMIQPLNRATFKALELRWQDVAFRNVDAVLVH